ncbi:hypothetical protein [Falsiroseomonas sp. HW251]|uniref:hypothetical protein n=1 Tax=Falsiroseomonas sp. HW251 TaxID=3390998 RepID=UPI003D318BB3
MPFDLVPSPRKPATDGADLPKVLHGVPRAALVRHALDQLAPSLRDAVAAIELESAGSFVNMGMNFDRVAWRAVWRRPGMPEAGGTIPVWKGEIA